MNPRYPTSAQFRRHPPRSNPFPRILVAFLVIGGGLMYLFRSKDPAPVESAASPVQAAPVEPPQRPAVVVPESKPETKAKTKPEAKLEIKPETKPPPPSADAKPSPKPEEKPVAQAEKQTRTEGKSMVRLDIRPEPPTTGRVESKPEVKPGNKSETKSDPGAKKGDAAPDAAAKSKTEASPAPVAQKPPPLPQPKEEPELSHPLPDALVPKLREQEMDLTFYKGLATKKMILPEEPTGKKIVPPFLAGLAPAGNTSKKGDGPSAAAKNAPAKPAVTPQKPPVEPKKPAEEAKKPVEEAKKATPDAAKKKGYQVQIAIFTDLKNATVLADSLRSQGAPNPRVSTLKYASGRSVFRVRMGPFASQAEASKAGQRWQSGGQPALVTAIEE